MYLGVVFWFLFVPPFFDGCLSCSISSEITGYVVWCLNLILESSLFLETFLLCYFFLHLVFSLGNVFLNCPIFLGCSIIVFIAFLSLFSLFTPVQEVSIDLCATSMTFSLAKYGLLLSPSKAFFILQCSLFLTFPLESSLVFPSLCLPILLHTVCFYI